MTFASVYPMYVENVEKKGRTEKVASASSLPDGARVLRRAELGKPVGNTRRFFQEFKDLAFDDLDEKRIQGLLKTHSLDADALVELGKKPRAT